MKAEKMPCEIERYNRYIINRKFVVLFVVFFYFKYYLNHCRVMADNLPNMPVHTKGLNASL